jgi:hypothetical protein
VISGVFPFTNPEKCKKTLYKQITQEEFVASPELSIEEEWFVNKMLMKDTDERASMSDVLKFLSHLIEL